MKKAMTTIMLVSLLSLVAGPPILQAEEEAKHNYKPAEGYVPDKATAIAIAVAVWVPIYGKENIENKKPFKAILKDGIWYVSGSVPLGWKGGVPEAEVSKDDGRTLRISHGK